MTDLGALLPRLRAALAAPADDEQAQAQLMPRLLDGSLARQRSTPPGVEPRVGAVLALLYPYDGQLMLPLTVRSEHLTHHRGEVSLPGGAVDDNDHNLAWTALREGQEELGIVPQAVELWTALSPVYIHPSNFQITPFVGYTPEPPDLQPHVAEVAAVLELPLLYLLQPDVVVVEQWMRRGVTMQVPFYPFGGYKIWGATALILSELAARARRAL